MRKIEYLGKCLVINEKGEKILVIGDLHIGFEESLNEGGVFVSRRMFNEMIEYLERVFAKTRNVDKIVLLGDVKHEFGRILRQEWNEVLELIDYLKSKLKKGGGIVIVRGNHDGGLRVLVRKRGIDVRDFFVLKEIAFLHGHKDFEEVHDKKINFWVMGHGHPAIKLREGVKAESYKCFLSGRFKGKKVIIMPSFFEHNTGSDFRENESGLAWNFNLRNFKVVAVGDNLNNFDFGLLKKIDKC